MNFRIECSIWYVHTKIDNQYYYFFISKINMNGGNYYETHITVDHRCTIGLMDFVRQEKNIKFILVYNPEGATNIQPMISRYQKYTNEKKCIKEAIILANKMIVLRTKVEMMIPDRLVNNILNSEIIYQKYIEYHLKVITPVPLTIVQNKCKELVKSFRYQEEDHNISLAASVNMAGSKKSVLLTIRIFNLYISECEIIKDKVLGLFTDMDIDGKIFQRECCIYDDNVHVDDGWL